MFTRTRATTNGAALLIAALAATSLSGCGAGSPMAVPTPTDTAEAAAFEKPEEGWCGEYGLTMNRWSGAALEVDEARFDEVLGVDFLGPADCYLELYSDVTLKSVVAVYIGERTEIADFMSSTLPDHGWAGEIADALKGGVFTNPEIGDLGYSYSADGKLSSIPVDGPVVQVTALLVG